MNKEPREFEKTVSTEDESNRVSAPRRRTVSLLLCLFLLVLAVALSAFTTWFFVNRAAKESERLLREEQSKALAELQSEYENDQTTLFDLDRLLAIDRLFSAHALNDVDKDALTEALLDAYVLGTGDAYAAHYTADEYLAMLERQNGRFVGIGVTILQDVEGGGLRVVSVYRDSPAEEAGILAGDCIVAADGVPFRGLTQEQAAGLVRGEEGTAVTLTLVRDGATMQISAVRRTVSETTVWGKMLDDGVAYVRILRFSKETPAQMGQTIEELKSLGAEAFAFDVRGNPGGLVSAVSECLGYLLPDGPVIRVNYANKEKSYIMRASDGKLICEYGNGTYTELSCQLDQKHVLDVPIAVLVDASTASAGEVFAAALRDYAAKNKMEARLFGSKTFGKGVAQVTYRTGKGDALKLTVATYDPPYGENYDGKGVIPDETVLPSAGFENRPPEQLTEKTDIPLKTAREWLARCVLEN